MPDTKMSTGELEPVPLTDVDRAFILHCPSLTELLFDRNLLGLEFTARCVQASEAFLSLFASELGSLGEGEVAELMLISKGLYYWMHNAFATVFKRNLEINFAATTRLEATGASARVTVPYHNLDAPAETLIVGDTIASGATLCTALELYLEQQRLRRLYVFTIVGSAVGGRRLAAFCRSRGIELTLVYGLGALGLAPNGFDLSFLHQETITRPVYRDRAAEAFRGKPVSSAGWDFGSQAQAITKYRMLCWIEAEYWGLQDTEVFAVKQRPTDTRLIQKELAACGSELMRITRVLAKASGEDGRT
jgi:hypothetical protein